MKLAVISAALLGAVLASKDAYRDIQFASFREQHGKHYSTKAEFELRKDIFHANLAKIATGNLPELSTQQVTACTPNPLSCGGTGGCYGSFPQLGYTYIQLFGHSMESDYPYTSGTTTETGDCMYDFTNTAPAVGITGYNTLAPNDQEAVMTHLAEVGPLAVAVYSLLHLQILLRQAWGVLYQVIL